MPFKRVFPFVIAALGLAVIGPALWSGWLGDDALYSSLDGMLGADHISVWQAMLNSFDAWFFGNGRFYPGLVVEKYLVFYFFTNLLAYKLLIVVATLATVELFRRCVAAYSSQPLANLSALIVVSLFCERGYQDAILSYDAMPQAVAILVLGSLLAFRSVLDRCPRYSRVAAIALYALATLTYEDAYGFCLLYLAVAVAQTRSWSRGLRFSWPYLAIGAGLMLFSFGARATAHLQTGSLYASNMDPAAILRTFADQATAALPLAYWVFDPQHIFSRTSLHNFYNDAPVQPLVFIAFALAAAYALRAFATEKLDPRKPVAAGIFVIAVAAAPIAILIKYQHELQLGLGYLPVFYEVFGVALALAAIAAWSAGLRGGHLYRIGWIAAIALVATMTQATNVRIVRGYQAAKEARNALERQLDAGLLRSLPEQSAIGIDAAPDWMAFTGGGPDGISTSALFYMHGGKRVGLVPATDPKAALLLRYDPTSLRWTLERRGP